MAVGIRPKHEICLLLGRKDERSFPA